MNPLRLEQLAKELLAGRIALADFVARASGPATADLAEAQLDLDRRRRCGYPEVVFGQGKTVATLAKIFERQMAERIDVLATRISPEQAAELSPQVSHGPLQPRGPHVPHSAGCAEWRGGQSPPVTWPSSPPARAICQLPKKPARRSSGWASK